MSMNRYITPGQKAGQQKRWQHKPSSKVKTTQSRKTESGEQKML
jgi:hypothetical protein